MQKVFRKGFSLSKLVFRRTSDNEAKPSIRQKITEKIPKENSNILNEFYYLIKSEKKLFMKVAVLSGMTSGILMLFPYALKGITELAGTRNEDFVKDAKSEKDPKEKKEDEPPKKKERSVFGIFKSIEEASPEVKNKYFKFISTWFPLFAMSGTLVFFRRLYSGDIANKIAYRLRYRLYSHLISRDLSFFTHHKTASTDFVHKMSNDVTTISNSVTVDLQFAFRSVIFAVGSTSYILLNSPELALMSCLVAGGLAFGTKGTNAKLRKAKTEETEELTNVSIIAGERLSNMKLIKVNNTEEAEKRHFLHSLNKFYAKSYDVQKYMAKNFGILDGLGQASVIGILTYGSFLVTMGYASSEMMAFSLYAMYAGLGFRGMYNALTELQKSAGLYKGIYDIIGSVKDDEIFKMEFKDFEKLLQKEERTGEIDTSVCLEHPPRIEFKDVSFNYLDSKILNNLSFEISPGTVVAITGSSGSGKTTVLNLLTKLFNPSYGEILIDGRDITEIDPVWVRMNVSYVTQEPILFMGTILDNIRYGNDDFDISEENCIRAAKLANAHDFIMNQPEGYYTKIGEKGMSLSGGQRQRIVIARALVKNPKILIMDESTSSLDPHSEKIIVDSLTDVVKERTCIIVTHKLEPYEKIITKHINLLPAARQIADVAPEEKVEEKSL